MGLFGDDIDWGEVGVIAGGGIPVLGALPQYLGVRDQNAANQRAVDQANSWSERMANTAHQRQVADLRAAGLNPILSANKGAAVPQPAVAKYENALGPAAASAQSSAISLMGLAQQGKQINSNVALQEAQQATQKAQATHSMASAKTQELQSVKLEKEMGAVEAEAEARRIGAKYDKEFAEIDAYSKRAREATGTLNSAKDLFMPKIKIENSGKTPPRRSKDWGTFNKKTGELYE